MQISRTLFGIAVAIAAGVAASQSGDAAYDEAAALGGRRQWGLSHIGGAPWARRSPRKRAKLARRGCRIG